MDNNSFFKNSKQCQDNEDRPFIVRKQQCYVFIHYQDSNKQKKKEKKFGTHIANRILLSLKSQENHKFV